MQCGNKRGMKRLVKGKFLEERKDRLSDLNWEMTRPTCTMGRTCWEAGQSNPLSDSRDVAARTRVWQHPRRGWVKQETFFKSIMEGKERKGCVLKHTRKRAGRLLRTRYVGNDLGKGERNDTIFLHFLCVVCTVRTKCISPFVLYYPINLH